jgi:hypothetical protein
MKYKLMNEQMSHEISHLPINLHDINMWNAWIMNEQMLHDLHL